MFFSVWWSIIKSQTRLFLTTRNLFSSELTVNSKRQGKSQMTDLSEELCRRDLPWILKETCETKNRIELSREWTQLKCLPKTWSFCCFHSSLSLCLFESCMCTLVTDANIIQARNEVWLSGQVSPLFSIHVSLPLFFFFFPSVLRRVVSLLPVFYDHFILSLFHFLLPRVYCYLSLLSSSRNSLPSS